MKYFYIPILVLLVLVSCLSIVSAAEEVYSFDCGESKIKGAIKYSVIGKYNAVFEECSGVVRYDQTLQQIISVRLEIEVNSIKSNCEWCDEIVLSKRLLDAEKYPLIVFEGHGFATTESGYSVLGNINLHGVSQDLHSKFNLQEKEDSTLLAGGKWVIKRKDFNITWNKFLDHGGVLVGDHITVDWEILAKKM
jgi:polyisoprenoid-binding protein YceI